MSMNLTRPSRFAVSACVTIALLIGFAAIRPSRESGISEDLLWHRKVNSADAADIVFAGDSRVLRGISTKAMASTFPDKAIRNLAFRSVPLNDKYLLFVKDSLRQSASRPMIAIGVSANSFTPKSVSANGYTDQQWRLGKKAPITAPALVWIKRQLKPISIRETQRMVLYPLSRKGQYDCCHLDGWMSGNKIPENSRASESLYRRRFDQNQVDPEIIAQSLDFVRETSKLGVRIVGYRVPTPDAILKIETDASGFDYEQYRIDFEQAGGHWVTVDQEGLNSYDGSHLNSQSATEFSVRLAKSIETVIGS